MRTSKSSNSFIHLKTCIKYLYCVRHTAEHWDHYSVQDDHHLCLLGDDSLIERSRTKSFLGCYGSMVSVGACHRRAQPSQREEGAHGGQRRHL